MFQMKHMHHSRVCKQWRSLNTLLDVFSQVKGHEKTLEERRSSLDAEIDSLTSILADLESSSPYKHRSTQVRNLQNVMQMWI